MVLKHTQQVFLYMFLILIPGANTSEARRDYISAPIICAQFSRDHPQTHPQVSSLSLASVTSLSFSSLFSKFTIHTFATGFPLQLVSGIYSKINII